MAIDPSTAFPGKIDNTQPANYPYGAAQDVSAPSAGDGTPWVALLLNDIFGLQQKLLDYASVVPSGTPDNIVASQYFDALQFLINALTKQKFSTEATTALAVDSTSHLKYVEMTNVSDSTVTVSPAVAPFGDTVTVERGVGAGLVTFVGAGVTIQPPELGGSLTIDTEQRVRTLVSKDAITWKLIG